MDQMLANVISRIFNNWTALKIGVEQSDIGDVNVAIDFKNYVTNYCENNPTCDIDDIQELLEDILDEEFDVICEDGSPREIATIINSFMILSREGNIEEIEVKYNQLAVTTTEWIIPNSTVVQKCKKDDSDTESSSDDEEMEQDNKNNDDNEEDDGWIKVERKKR